MRRCPAVPPRTVPPLTIVAVTVAVLAISSSAPLITFAAAPAFAIAFWRNTLAIGVLSPFALTRRRAEVHALTVGKDRREGLFCVLAGLALAGHFASWLPSVKLTTVAAAAALGATQPVWQGLIALAQGRRLSLVTWLGIAIAVLGAILATGADFGVSGRAFAGDVLAIVGGLAAAVYIALGERVRATTSTTVYTTICYAVCAVVLGTVCLVAGVPLTGFPVTAWLAILALTVGAQLLGHSMFNFALRRISATTVSILILLEVPGAALIAWAWLGQTPHAASLPGLVLLVVGVAVVVLGGGRRVRTPDAAADAGALASPDRI